VRAGRDVRLWSETVVIVSIYSCSKTICDGIAKRCNCLTPPPFATAKVRDASACKYLKLRAPTYHLDCVLVGPGGVDGVSRVVCDNFRGWRNSMSAVCRAKPLVGARKRGAALRRSGQGSSDLMMPEHQSALLLLPRLHSLPFL
jgi:hypothetical protein